MNMAYNEQPPVTTVQQCHINYYMLRTVKLFSTGECLSVETYIIIKNFKACLSVTVVSVASHYSYWHEKSPIEVTAYECSVATQK
jgi:hypothetical protein